MTKTVHHTLSDMQSFIGTSMILIACTRDQQCGLTTYDKVLKEENGVLKIPSICGDLTLTEGNFAYWVEKNTITVYIN